MAESRTSFDRESREALRQRLLAQREELQKEIDDLLARRRRDQTIQREQSVRDAGDESLKDATGDEQVSLLEMRNRTRVQLDEILRRIDEGTYGICEDCGEPIGRERLEVLPLALDVCGAKTKLRKSSVSKRHWTGRPSDPPLASFDEDYSGTYATAGSRNGTTGCRTTVQPPM